METRLLKTNSWMMVVLLAALAAFSGCRKDDPEYDSIKEVLNISVAEDFTASIAVMDTIAELPAAIAAAADAAEQVMSTDAIERFSTASLDEVIADLQAAIILTSQEKKKLADNDATVYKDVIYRIAALPTFTTDTEIAQIAVNMATNDLWSPYVMDSHKSSTHLYANNYDIGAAKMQDFITNQTLVALTKINLLEKAFDNPPATELTTEQKKQFATLVCITLYHFQEFMNRFKESLPIHDGGSSN